MKNALILHGTDFSKEQKPEPVIPEPESTEYVGDHYVECYAIKNNHCIAKSKVPVKII
ncbi:MAG: hypothetical protein Q7K55_08435 [Candidatus Levybacteria bacterium]|nr:hypothetical protein [Candidatus Levybacteria bacterium]